MNKYFTRWEGTHDSTSSVKEVDAVTIVESARLS
jgi:hypothetical protein